MRGKHGTCHARHGHGDQKRGYHADTKFDKTVFAMAVHYLADDRKTLAGQDDFDLNLYLRQEISQDPARHALWPACRDARGAGREQGVRIIAAGEGMP